LLVRATDAVFRFQHYHAAPRAGGIYPALSLTRPKRKTQSHIAVITIPGYTLLDRKFRLFGLMDDHIEFRVVEFASGSLEVQATTTTDAIEVFEELVLQIGERWPTIMPALSTAHTQLSRGAIWVGQPFDVVQQNVTDLFDSLDVDGEIMDVHTTHGPVFRTQCTAWYQDTHGKDQPLVSIAVQQLREALTGVYGFFPATKTDEARSAQARIQHLFQEKLQPHILTRPTPATSEAVPDRERAADSLRAEATGSSQIEATTEKRRERGPSSETLEACQLAMKSWLEDGLSLTEASQLAAIDKATVQRWIPNVLTIIEPDRRARWIVLIKALNKTKWLGKYADV
jgi:hypothetical protein